MRKKAYGILAGAAVGLLAALAAGCGNVTEPSPAVEESAETEESEDTFLDEEAQEKIRDLEELIDQYFLFEENEEDMEEGIYAGMLAGLGDPYSVYYTEEEYAQLMETASGAYCGIGTLVSQNSDTGMISVVRVFADSPGEKAGLQPEDVIVAVDGTEITGMDLDLVVNQYVKGEEGTEVVITILRPSTGEYLELPMTRQVVEAVTVAGQMLDEQIGYVAVGQFEMTTSGQFASVIDQLEDEGMTSLIIDLRGNPGGVLDAVVEMMDYILPDDISNYARGGSATTLIYTEDKRGDGDSYAAKDGHSVDLPMVVLIDENSASASEVFAGAMKDYGWATLVGTTSFGKGIVQNIFPLEDGTAVKLTVANYYTPGGQNIHGTGIEPDVEVELDPELATRLSISLEEDNQLQKAVEILTTGEGLVSRLEVEPALAVEVSDGQPACTVQDHLEATYESATETIFGVLEDAGYVASYRVDSHADEAEAGGSRYHLTQFRLVKTAQEYNGFDLLSVDSDLGSGQLHSLMLQLAEPEIAGEALCAMVSTLGEAASASVPEGDLDALRIQLADLENGDSFTIETEAFHAQVGRISSVYMMIFEPAR